MRGIASLAGAHRAEPVGWALCRVRSLSGPSPVGALLCCGAGGPGARRRCTARFAGPSSMLDLACGRLLTCATAIVGSTARANGAWPAACLPGWQVDLERYWRLLVISCVVCRNQERASWPPRNVPAGSRGGRARLEGQENTNFSSGNPDRGTPLSPTWALACG